VRPDRQGIAAGLTGTVLAHGLALLALLAVAMERPEPLGTVYAVNLVAAPALPPAARRAVVEATPRPPAAAERTAPINPPKRSAKVAPAAPTSRPQPRAEAAPQTAAVQPLPGETGTGTDIANLSTPGADFPFPEYLRNIVTQIYRRWNRPAGSPALRAEVSFLILRDGSVREITLASRSRSYSFDLGAQGAVEAAANARAFGPLPEGFKTEVLQISLWFVPRGTQ
jgi:outer membrane biosynthesis protein TonB